MKMKFLIVGDLHGEKPEIHYKNFDAIIAPGDFCSSGESRKYMFEAIKLKMQNPKSKVTWYEIVGRKNAQRIVRDSLKAGRVILEQLNSYGKPVYFVPGNNDWLPEKDSKWGFLKKNHYKNLVKGLDNLVDLHHKILEVNDVQIIGYGLSSSPEYPQYRDDIKRLKKRELAKKKKDYEKEYSTMAKLFTKTNEPVIYLSHNVPFNTKIDAITDKNSPKCGYHYGSLVTRKMVERFHPLICIGGHMHEHFGKDKLGKTVIVNAGFGSKVNTLLEIKNGKIKKLEFYDGK